MTDFEQASAGHSSAALSSLEVFPPDPAAVVSRGGLAVGVASYDVVMAEHVPLMPGGESCRACGFVYGRQRVCPAQILAAAGYPVLADRIRVVPASDPEQRAVAELTVAVQRMDARLDMISARVLAVPVKRPLARWLARLADTRI